MSYLGAGLKSWTKHGDSPVSEADIAVDKFLRERLTRLLPDAGWLSEETEDDRARLDAARRLGGRSDRRHARLSSTAAPTGRSSVALVEHGRPLRAARVRPDGRRALSRGRRRRRDARRRAAGGERERQLSTARARPGRSRCSASSASIAPALRRRAEGPFARAAPRARRVGQARRRVRLAGQPRLGPCRRRSHRARGRRRADHVRRANRWSTTAATRAMPRWSRPGRAARAADRDHAANGARAGALHESLA